MLTLNKTIMIIFMVFTIASASLTSYGVYLLFGAYDVGRLLHVSVSKIEVSRSNSSDEASISIYLLIDNPTKTDLKLLYVGGSVFLNGQSLTPSYSPARLIAYSNPILLRSSSETPVPPIGISGVPGNKIPTESSRIWFIMMRLIVSQIPLIGTASYSRMVQYSEGGS